MKRELLYVKWVFARIICVAFTMVSIGSANSAEFRIGPHGNSVLIEGEIKSGDFFKYQLFIANSLLADPNTNIGYGSVYLDSLGGDVEEALIFAKYFTAQFTAVFVPDGKNCFSACTVMWAGGIHRSLMGEARLGFHRLSFKGKELNVKKSKEVTDRANQKVTAFFHQVGFPSLLIEKMNETPPSDIYLVNNEWLNDHELSEAMGYQPAFFDVVEKQCGRDPSTIIMKAIAARQRKEKITPSEMTAYKNWLDCGEGVKRTNRLMAFSSDENTQISSVVSSTHWSFAGGDSSPNHSFSVWVGKDKVRWIGRVASLLAVNNIRESNGSFTSALQYLTIDCDAMTVLTTKVVFCSGKLCETPLITLPFRKDLKPVKVYLGDPLGWVAAAICDRELVKKPN